VLELFGRALLAAESVIGFVVLLHTAVQTDLLSLRQGRLFVGEHALVETGVLHAHDEESLRLGHLLRRQVDGDVHY